MRVLVVEDYAPLRKSIARGLSEAGFAVDTAEDGEEGLWHATSSDYDVVVLDLMLPKVDGLSILRGIRKRQRPTNVLILTAKDTVPDRVAGLNLGADDYLIKPFAFDELLARVHALVRRKYETRSPLIQIADMEIDTGARRVARAGRTLELTAREYAILEFLGHRRNQVVTRAEIWEHVADFASETNSNVVDVYIGFLRKKLEEGHLPRLIHTRRGMGYVLGEKS